MPSDCQGATSEGKELVRDGSRRAVGKRWIKAGGRVTRDVKAGGREDLPWEDHASRKVDEEFVNFDREESNGRRHP